MYVHLYTFFHVIYKNERRTFSVCPIQYNIFFFDIVYNVKRNEFSVFGIKYEPNVDENEIK